MKKNLDWRADHSLSKISRSQILSNRLSSEILILKKLDPRAQLLSELPESSQVSMNPDTTQPNHLSQEGTSAILPTTESIHPLDKLNAIVSSITDSPLPKIPQPVSLKCWELTLRSASQSQDTTCRPPPEEHPTQSRDTSHPHIL